jgi:hypothetical protein
MGRQKDANSDTDDEGFSGTAQHPLLHKIPIARALFRGNRWTRADTLTGLGLVVAAIVAGVSIWQSERAGTDARLSVPSVVALSTAPPHPDLVVDKVEVARTEDIDAVHTDEDRSNSKVKATGSVIDVTLRNNGAAPALLVGADAAFDSVEKLDNCVGFGPGGVTAQYDMKVPEDPAVTNHPFKLHRDMRFVVAPNSIDRFQLTVGPQTYGDASWPWIYRFSLSLSQDNERALNVGQIVMLGLPGAHWNVFSGVSASLYALGVAYPCVTKDANLLSAAITSPGLHSPELQTLYTETKTVIASLPSCSSGHWTYNGCLMATGRYVADPRGVIACADTLEVVQNSNCQVAELVKSTYGHKRLEALPLTVVQGATTMPMECGPSGTAEICRSTDGLGTIVGFVP